MKARWDARWLGLGFAWVGALHLVTGCGGDGGSQGSADAQDLISDSGPGDSVGDGLADGPPGSSGGDVVASPLEIAGTYTDDWGGTHEITSETWTMVGMGVYHIEKYDNEGNWLVAQNDSKNQYNPGLWSRMDWTVFQDTLYYCQTAYDKASLEAAEQTPPADASDPTTGGCGGFPWTALKPVAGS